MQVTVLDGATFQSESIPELATPRADVGGVLLYASRQHPNKNTEHFMGEYHKEASSHLVFLIFLCQTCLNLTQNKETH